MVGYHLRENLNGPSSTAGKTMSATERRHEASLRLALTAGEFCSSRFLTGDGSSRRYPIQAQAFSLSGADARSVADSDHRSRVADGMVATARYEMGCSGLMAIGAGIEI